MLVPAQGRRQPGFTRRTGPRCARYTREEELRRAMTEVKLNVLGKPFGSGYAPNYKMKFKGTGVARLRAPYGREMRFVGDPPKTDDEWHRRHQRARSAPLLDALSPPAAQLDEIIRAGRTFFVALEKFQRAAEQFK